MEENMSKRLKLQFGGESEMEERSFNNPNPDCKAVFSVPLNPREGGPEQDLSARDQDIPFNKDGKVNKALSKGRGVQGASA
ncbi:hypothetical protein NDU88_007067 [Pleurodeles waltl]|uniref:Uncharacterized protein n=1 Tax=Pleurodeles waltl TaxID=8319 RepID=A0AAV7P158_PLEWA|nr:hypothetical protein NDU88_007067 [Pleurodeles waltl]